MKKLINLLFSNPVVGFSTVASFALAIYLGFFYEKKTEVTYELLSDSYVVEIHEKLSKLDILYDGNSLKKENQALRVITLKVLNTGENTIRIADYDQKAPLGLSLSHGELVDEPTILASNSYLAEHLAVSKLSKNSLSFSPVILEPRDNFLITLLVLVKDVVPPKLGSFGKIAGTWDERPKIVDLSAIAKHKPVYADAFGGGLGIQVLRAVSYFFIFIVSLISVLAVFSMPTQIADYLEDKRTRATRIQIVNGYIASNSLAYSACKEAIFRAYTDDRKPDWGSATMSQIAELAITEGLIEQLNKTVSKDILKIVSARLRNDYFGCKEIIEKCKDEGASESHQRDQLIHGLSDFMDFLQAKGHPVERGLRIRTIEVNVLPLDAYKTPAKFQWVGSNNGLESE